MLRFSLLAVLVLGTAPATAAERRYTVTDFDRIQVDGPYRVSVVTGRHSAARASGTSAALDRLSVEVQGRMLRIRPNSSGWGGNDRDAQEPVTVEVTTDTLRYAGINGSAIVEIDRLEAMRVDLVVAGSGRIEASSIKADRLNLNLLGSGQMRLAGATKSARAEIHGSGDLSASGLIAADADIFADTAGTIAMEVTRSANVVASATGDVAITGNAACTVKRQGTGRVVCGR